VSVDIRTTRFFGSEETYDGGLVIDEWDYDTSFTILLVDIVNVLSVGPFNPVGTKSLDT
jgi:hypothetical protein